MAISHPNRRGSSDIDVESSGIGIGIGHRKDWSDDGDSIADRHDADYDADPAGEGTRFLPMDIFPDIVPTQTTDRYVIIMCVQFLFIIEFSQFIMEPPLQEIMEDFVCHAHYPDHRTGELQTPDSRCKDADVQGTLAMARSWMMWVGMLVRR